MKKSIRSALWIGVFLVCSISAQTFGEISGSVIDPSNSAIPAAEVTITSQASAQRRRVVTSSGGVFKAPFLSPGKYDITVSAAGFRNAVRHSVEVQVDSIARVDFTLEVGSVAEAVEVQGGAQLLETENAAVGTVIENKRIIELPLNGRNWLQMVALSPNVSADMRASGHVDSRQ